MQEDEAASDGFYGMIEKKVKTLDKGIQEWMEDQVWELWKRARSMNDGMNDGINAGMNAGMNVQCVPDMNAVSNGRNIFECLNYINN